MFSFKSRAWQLGLTGLLLVCTYLGSLTTFISSFEYDLFLFIVSLKPDALEQYQTSSITLAPQWSVLTVYALILAVYVRKYTRSRTTAVSLLTISIILFCLLMLDVLLAIFGQYYLPVVLPGLVMLLVSSVYWLIDLYQKIGAGILAQKDNITLQDIRYQIEKSELENAFVMLKQCPYRDELLEVGYELGMLLESGKHWASALKLYHWLSQYDPGLSDFVARIEEIKSPSTQVMENKQMIQAKQVIGHFEIQRKIASGATAIVYEATDLRTQNRVALKVMMSKLDETIEQERIKHWLHEAEIVSQLEHRNIVKIHDAAVDNNQAYIAMDYIPGYPMSLRLRKRQYITVGECIRILKAVLRALGAAHTHGVIHGDIKPANIMYDDKHDTYIVTDFGAAYTAQRNRLGDNVIIGTPSYMSPEQLKGKKLDGRSDIFSLAVTMYHLLTGHQPFTGDNLPKLKQSIVGDDPNLDHLSLPAGLKEVLLKALQKKTYMRFTDAQQMLNSVEFCEAQLIDRKRQSSV